MRKWRKQVFQRQANAAKRKAKTDKKRARDNDETADTVPESAEPLEGAAPVSAPAPSLRRRVISPGRVPTPPPPDRRPREPSEHPDSHRSPSTPYSERCRRIDERHDRAEATQHQRDWYEGDRERSSYYERTRRIDEKYAHQEVEHDAGQHQRDGYEGDRDNSRPRPPLRMRSRSNAFESKQKQPPTKPCTQYLYDERGRRVFRLEQTLERCDSRDRLHPC